MNPDKLFDYLEGKLPDWERAQLEEKLANDPQVQKEFAVARRIHANMRGDSREVLLEDDQETLRRGRRMALRVGTAFVVLMGLNVAIGLWFIAHKEGSNPNRKLLEEQMRKQLLDSAQRAAASLTPPPLGVSEITIPAQTGQLETVADKIVTLAQQAGGSATKELPDSNQIGVLVDLPAAREAEFRSGLAALTGTQAPPQSAPNDTAPSSTDKLSLIVHVIGPAKP